MPVVRVSIRTGRTAEQKREIAEIITDALVRVIGSKRHAVNVMFENVPVEDWVIGAGSDTTAAATGKK